MAIFDITINQTELQTLVEQAVNDAVNQPNTILFRRFTAGHYKPERFTKLNATNGSPYRYYKLISVPVGTVNKGDLVEVSKAGCQISSKNRYNLMIASVVRLHEGAGPNEALGDTGTNWPGQEITEAVGENINNNVHHKPLLQTGEITASKDYLDAYVSLIVYTASTAYSSGDLITVDQDYGRLEGKIWSKDSFTII